MSTNHTTTNDQSRISQILLSFLKFNTTNANLPNQEISDSDWEEVLQESNRQRIGGLLYHRLVGISQDYEIPSWVLQTLHQKYADTALRNMQIYLELHKVLDILQKSDIPVIVLKGAYLAQGVYRDIALRSMGDIDILVKKKDIDKAVRKFFEMGYLLIGEYVGWDIQVDEHYHFIFAHPNSVVQIELHWKLQPSDWPYCIDTNELWKRSQLTSIAGVDVHVLSPEELLLHICLQVSYQHPFDLRPLRSLLDISEIIRFYRSQLNWKLINKISKQWGANNNVYITLRVVIETLNVTVPQEALDIQASQDFDPRFIKWANERIFMKIEPHEVDQNPLMSGRFANIYKSQGLINKMSAVLLVCFPPKITMANLYSLPVGSKQVYFYYPVRIIDLFKEYSSIAWRILTGDQEIMSWIDREGKRSALMDWVIPENQTGI